MRIDLVIESENVFTGTSDAAKPGAIAIAQDRIVAVGPRDEVHAFVRKENEGGELPPVRNMGDALVAPGFHDSHLHFFHSAIYASPMATTFLGENEADCVQRRGGASTDGTRPFCPRKRRLTKHSLPARSLSIQETPIRCG